jgi:hypothetical protein
MSPASGAIVMGTGIVSVALLLDGRVTLSRVLLVCTAAAWIVLGGLLAGRWLRDRARVRVAASTRRAAPSGRCSPWRTGSPGVFPNPNPTDEFTNSAF